MLLVDGEIPFILSLIMFCVRDKRNDYASMDEKGQIKIKSLKLVDQVYKSHKLGYKAFEWKKKYPLVTWTTVNSSQALVYSLFSLEKGYCSLRQSYKLIMIKAERFLITGLLERFGLITEVRIRFIKIYKNTQLL